VGTGPIAGRAGFARERPGRCAPIHRLATWWSSAPNSTRSWVS